MKSLRFFYIALFLVSNFSCNNLLKKTDEDLYSEKTNELITQILDDFSDESSCIIEPYIQNLVEFKKTHLPPDIFPKIKSDIMKALDVENDSIFNKLINLSNSFRFDKSTLNTDLHYISREYYNSLLSEKGYEGAILYLMENECEKDFIALSKPIFNEDFSIAIIEFEGMMSGSLIAFKFENGKWIDFELISSWIA